MWPSARHPGRYLMAFIVLVLLVSAASQWWARRQQGAVGEQVARLAQRGDIRMIASDTCVVCLLARKWFGEHGVAYTECSIERDAPCRADFEALGAPGTPVIVVRGRPQLGFSPERLLDALSGPA
ncbi:MAG: glutaredoxin family protein [Proteobacteria bacterium]|jgi:glutaredoxin|nr:glutaredoxin family protein [Pseudomonadota bacterium]